MGVIFAAVAAGAAAGAGAAVAVAAWGREEGFADAALLWACTAVDSSIMSSDESTQVYRTGRSPQTFWVALRPLSSRLGSNRLELPVSEAAKRRDSDAVILKHDVVSVTESVTLSVTFGVYDDGTVAEDGTATHPPYRGPDTRAKVQHTPWSEVRPAKLELQRTKRNRPLEGWLAAASHSLPLPHYPRAWVRPTCRGLGLEIEMLSPMKWACCWPAVQHPPACCSPTSSRTRRVAA